MEKYPKCYKATLENKKENTKPSASNQRSISDKVNIRNHRQPLYSKRPHNLPVKENKKTFAQSAIRILQNRLKEKIKE